MSESHFLRNSLLFVGGLVIAGWIAFDILGWLFHIILYLALGAVVVGGGMYLYGRAKRAIRNGEVRRKITRRY